MRGLLGGGLGFCRGWEGGDDGDERGSRRGREEDRRVVCVQERNEVGKKG